MKTVRMHHKISALFPILLDPRNIKSSVRALILYVQLSCFISKAWALSSHYEKSLQGISWRDGRQGSTLFQHLCLDTRGHLARQPNLDLILLHLPTFLELHTSHTHTTQPISYRSQACKSPSNTSIPCVLLMTMHEFKFHLHHVWLCKRFL